MMRAAGCGGGGLLLVLALVCCGWATSKLLYSNIELQYAFIITHIPLPLDA